MQLRFGIAMAVAEATAATPTRPLAREFPYAAGTVLKRKKIYNVEYQCNLDWCPIDYGQVENTKAVILEDLPTGQPNRTPPMRDFPLKKKKNCFWTILTVRKFFFLHCTEICFPVTSSLWSVLPQKQHKTNLGLFPHDSILNIWKWLSGFP